MTRADADARTGRVITLEKEDAQRVIQEIQYRHRMLISTQKQILRARAISRSVAVHKRLNERLNNIAPSIRRCEEALGALYAAIMGDTNQCPYCEKVPIFGERNCRDHRNWTKPFDRTCTVCGAKPGEPCIKEDHQYGNTE